MSILGRLGKGFITHVTTGSLVGGMAAALTNNFGIGLATGIGSRLLRGGAGMGLGMMGMMGMGGMGMGMGMGGMGMGMGMGMGSGMYNMAYNGVFDTAAWGSHF
jgi:hypothetical protein